MNDPVRLAYAEGTRELCGWFLIGLLALAGLGVLPVVEELNPVGLHSCFSSIDALSWLWLACAVPIGAVCITVHYLVPGPGRGKGWLTDILVAEFGLVTLGWLGVRVWWYGEMLGIKSAAFDCLWWLKPLAWLWS